MPLAMGGAGSRVPVPNTIASRRVALGYSSVLRPRRPSPSRSGASNGSMSTRVQDRQRVPPTVVATAPPAESAVARWDLVQATAISTRLAVATRDRVKTDFILLTSIGATTELSSLL